MTPQTLLYLTGGLAYGGVRSTRPPAPGAATFASYSDWRTGWTLGGGLEHAFTPNMTARIEYRYTDLGTATSPAWPRTRSTAATLPTAPSAPA